MARTRLLAGVIGLAVAAGLSAGGAAQASTLRPVAAVTAYPNCTALHVQYKGGVAMPKAVDHRAGGGHARYARYVSAALYEANKKMDRDHDGIACEQ